MSDLLTQAPDALTAPVDEPQRPLQRRTRPLYFDAELWGPAELKTKLGVSNTQFHLLQKRGAFNHLMVTRPVGTRRYSRVLCERFFAGESTVRFGKGSRSHD